MVKNINFWVATFLAWAVLAVVGFFIGIGLAALLDEADSKLPNIWTTEAELVEVIDQNNLPINGDQLQVKPNYGYQNKQEFNEQPAYNITKLEQVEL